MRRDIFVKGIERYHEKVVNVLGRRKTAPELVEDAFQSMVVSLLDNKSYLKLDFDALDFRVYKFLKTATKGHISHALRRRDLEDRIFVSVDSGVDTDTEKEKTEKVDPRRKEKAEQECPFCHDETLNEHKACAGCHTILGQGKTVREHLSIDEADLASMPDMNMLIDVNNALDELTDLERKVVNSIAQGHDTLDGLAELNEMSRVSLWRVYVRAKQKLQVSLSEYA